MVLIECFPQQLVILEDESLNLSQVVCADTPVPRKANSRFEPKLALSIWSSDVDVRWLLSLI